MLCKVTHCVGHVSANKRLAFLAGVGRFKNKSYTDFLKAWNTARGLKTKIGPVEVCAVTAQLLWDVLAVV